MSETPQFSVRCPLPLLAKIDGLVSAKAASDRERFGYTRRGSSTRSAVIVELIKEAFAARELADRALAGDVDAIATVEEREKPKKVYSTPTLTEFDRKPAAFVDPRNKPESMKARTKRLAKFKSPKRTPAKVSPKKAAAARVSPKARGSRKVSPTKKAARVVRKPKRR